MEIGRTIEGGGTDSGGSEGCGGGYTVTLGKGTTKDAETGLMLEMMRMMMGLMGAPTDTAPPIRFQVPSNTDSVYQSGVMEGRRIQTEIFNNRGRND